MTEEQLGQLMQATARREGHKPALPEISQFSAHLQSSADVRRRRLENEVHEAMTEIGRPTTPREILSMLDDASVDHVQNALRRLKSRKIVKTVVVTTKRVNKTMWGLA
jgi:SOS-response transcriptional repressor LexA